MLITGFLRTTLDHPVECRTQESGTDQSFDLRPATLDVISKEEKLIATLRFFTIRKLFRILNLIES